MILLSAAVVVAGVINLNTIRVSKYQVNVPKRNSLADSVRIAFVADLHLQQNTRLGFIEQFIRKVNAEKPDIMLFGGDMLEGDHENESTAAIESAIKSIRP